jgi:hypothetical protein
MIFIGVNNLPSLGVMWADLTWRSLLITAIYAVAVIVFRLAPELVRQIPVIGKYLDR